ncbi:MAG: TonB-dependent receptor [Gammaproteobacteria bacterium]|nr:TonB-dependent receptor [Gammaproteobacteria bacterium]
MQNLNGIDSGSGPRDLRNAIRYALAAGAGAVASLGTQSAVAQTAPESKSADNQGLEEVIVTGTRIRRVDQETANPVITISHENIEKSGIANIGDLVARLPSAAGAAINPATNNGGGFGETNIELRGLEARRTLILVDGRRIGIVGASDATDVSQIPVSMIERVEVLKEGAGAIYGSDAIAGVVNFITRKDINGLELHADYGVTSRNDGAHNSVSATFGSATDKMSFVLGGSVSKQDQVFAGNRDYSSHALYFYGGTSGVVVGGSSRVPTGRIFLPAGSALRTQYGCSSLTRVAGAAGTAPADYRCFKNPADLFNYQPYNLIMTPLERSAVFSKVNYEINDYADVYANVLVNRTHSGFHIAPLPFDSINDDITLSKNSIYNIFGIDFGGISGANPDFTLRTVAFGDRKSDTVSDSKIVNGGVKGKLADTGWNWDLNLSYSRLDQLANVTGYYAHSSLQAAVGPSFIDATGTPTCGTPTAPISGCIPVNLFNPTAAGQDAAIKSVSADYNTNNTSTYKAVALDLNGKVYTLPAGDLQAAVGFEYNDRKGIFNADSIVQATPPLYLTCGLSQETCTGNTNGGYNSKQEYLELYVPLLKDMPAAHSLSLDYGLRHANYELFGSSTRSDFKIEYRPIKDLLVRGTYSQIFRVPTVSDIASSPVNSSITFNDPCTGLTTAQATGPNAANIALACAGVVPGTNFAQPNGQITGLLESNKNAKPETGSVTTYGFVWEPHQVSGLSLEVDMWSYTINELITTLDPNYSINQCITSGNPYYCSLVHRYTSGPNSGLILVFESPTFNIGSLKTDGMDFDVRYNLKDTRIGSFAFTADVTRVTKYVNIPAPGAAPDDKLGTYTTQFGNISKLRGLMTVGWNYKRFDALLTGRYLGAIDVPHPTRSGKDPTGKPYAPGAEPPLPIASQTYLDFEVGVSLPHQVRFQLGVRNLTDKQAPVLYQNNVTNANTDVNTYDTLGRQYFATLGAKF